MQKNPEHTPAIIISLEEAKAPPSHVNYNIALSMLSLIGRRVPVSYHRAPPLLVY